MTDPSPDSPAPEAAVEPAAGEATGGGPLQPAGRPFEEFGLAPDVLSVLGRLGIRKATPIQELVIEPILAGKDVIGKAETGTGKTIGFGAPIVGKIDTQRVAVQAMVLTPTRELAQQVAGVMEQLGSGRGLGVALVVGGIHASGQVLKLRSGSQVVVGTPGRVLDFLRDRTLSLVWCETVVLDEADRMLDMGFIDEVSAILDRIPPERQTLLFSATIPPEVNRLSQRYMRNPEVHSTAEGIATVSEIRQLYQAVEFRDKFRALRRILDESPEDTCIIFCNTRRQAIDLDRMLWGHGYAAGALHGEQEQDVRFKILESFRKREIRILVATDVASRGLDIEDIARIINYEVPDEPEGYVHRIGRTGRASRTGTAITLVSDKEADDWRRIVRVTGFSVEPIGSPLSMEGGGPGRSEGRRGEGGGRGGRDGGREGGRRRGGGARGGERRGQGESRGRGTREGRGGRQGGERAGGDRHGADRQGADRHAQHAGERRGGERHGGRGDHHAGAEPHHGREHGGGRHPASGAPRSGEPRGPDHRGPHHRGPEPRGPDPGGAGPRGGDRGGGRRRRRRRGKGGGGGGGQKPAS